MGKTLHKGAVDPVVGHPLKVADYGFTIVRTEGLGRRSVFIGERGGVEFVVIVFKYIRPKVNGDIPRPKHFFAFLCPVHPAEIGPVAFAVEPPLIAGHHFAGQRAGIHSGVGRAFIGLQHVLLLFRRHYRKERKTDQCQDQDAVRNFHVRSFVLIHINSNDFDCALLFVLACSFHPILETGFQLGHLGNIIF